MAWLLYLISAIIHNKLASFLQSDDSPPDREVVAMEAALYCYAFECLNFYDSLTKQGMLFFIISALQSSLFIHLGYRPTKATPILELAFIAFLMKFCKTYVSDEAFRENEVIYLVCLSFVSFWFVSYILFCLIR
jgi:hypothetical protein